MASQQAAAAAVAVDGGGLTTSMGGSQKGDVYSFAVIMHEIIYRVGLFRCTDDDQPIPAKSQSLPAILPRLYRANGSYRPHTKG